MESQRLVWIYAGVALVAGVGLASAMAPSDAMAGGPACRRVRCLTKPRVLLLGDSFALGLAVPMAKMAAEDKVPFFTAAKAGTTVAHWAPLVAAGLEKLSAGVAPTMVLVSLGTNDMKAPGPLRERPVLAKMVHDVERSGAVLVWVAPPSLPFPDKGFRSMIADTSAEIYPSEALVLQRGPDGVHPTATGYAGWAGAIWRWLR
jgi:hypothetical protein